MLEINGYVFCMAIEESPTQFLPLYAQVKQLLVQRLIDKNWTPGMMVPSEHQLATELRVSQGTVRKALDEMAAEKLVIRRQGRGTFVSEHSPEQLLFHFFRLVGQDDEQQIPESRVVDANTATCSKLEAKRLALNPRDRVTRITRLRLLNHKPTIFEVLSVPIKLIPDLVKETTLPNTLYGFYQQEYGLSVLKVVERIRAVAANEEAAENLGVEYGSPLLEIERTACSIDGTAIELRVSLCSTENHHYIVELT